jgi:tripeptidyl-peptidase I
MLPLLKAVLFAFSFGSVLASPAPRAMIVHERRESVPSGFVRNGAAPSNQVLNLRLALVQSDRAGLEDALMAVSTPGNAQYRQFLSKEEVEAFVAPSQETSEAITKFLSDNSLTASKVTPAGDWLSIDVTVEQANNLFGAQFDSFTRQSTGDTTVRTLEYSIPADLQGHLDFVHPTVACVLVMSC